MGVYDAISSLVNLVTRKPSEQVLRGRLLEEASKWVGLTDIRGVDVFRQAVDGVAEGEPWCAAFVQYCVSATAIRNKASISLYPSELCSAIWDNTPKNYRLEDPIPGSIIIWNYPGTIKGHTGIVLKVLNDGAHIKTIEGNTKEKDGVVGVHTKLRDVKGTAGMRVLGFLKPFK